MSPRPRAASALAAAALVLCCASPRPAVAFELRGLAAITGMATTSPSFSGLDDGELGLRLRFDLLDLGGRVDLRADFWSRLGFVGNPTVQELRQLALKVRDLGKVADLTLGRFFTPGGFWLIADGARLDLRYTDWLTHAVYGGLRAFTTDRRNADLTLDNPVALPLAGTSLAVRHRRFDLSLTFTWAREAIDLQNTWISASNTLTRERHVEDEFFLDAQALVLPSDSVILAGGASFGTRFDVRFDTGDPTAPATLGVATLGALTAWLMADWRPTSTLRLLYSGDFERLRLVQTELPFRTADGTPALAAGGDFLDNSVRAVWQAWRSLRADLRYRIRYRENTDLEHHVVAGLQADGIIGGLGAFASVGVDLVQPGVNTLRRVLYSGGLSYFAQGLDLRAGVLFTDGIGSGLLFSQRQCAADGGGNGTTPRYLFPYLLESNRIAFVRLFGSWRGLFGGLDVEENLDTLQLRALVQLGVSR